jgi:hypothetical protein
MERMGSCPDSIKRLIEHFDHQSDQVRSADYNEAQLRVDFVDPMFRELGWDIPNEQRFAEQYREVVYEDRVKVAGATKAPDYSFRIGGVRKFFLETKKPAVKIKDHVDPAYQLRRYGWSARLAVSILTNFEGLAVYDCRIQPKHLDKASTARREYLTHHEYVQKWDFLEGTFSKRAIQAGDFDRYCQSQKGRGALEFDEAFLEEIEEWRKKLASSLALRNENLDERSLNFSVQRIIDRIIFLRICEDRGIEHVGQLQGLLNGENVYRRLQTLFSNADDRYNSGLFHFKAEKDREEQPDELTPGLELDDDALKAIIRRLYYPESPYEFTVVSADILGSVYERFLGNVIRLTAGHRAKVEEKPEVRKAGGVYYTPTYIVDYIVQHTVGKLLGEGHEGTAAERHEGTEARRHEGEEEEEERREEVTPKEAAKLKILDPACGSGSFLLGAYQYLLDWHLKWYLADGPEKWSKGKGATLRPGPAGDWRLTIKERKRILLDNIHGVDIDFQAVEVTKLSLLLKVLEGETSESVGGLWAFSHERALPDLGRNIQCGNSLIGTDIMATEAWGRMGEEEKRRINPFDFERAFSRVFKQGGFDAVIGNPPYIDSEWMTVHWPETRAYCVRRYSSASGNWDIFCVFLERSLNLTRINGLASMIVPNKVASASYATETRRVLACTNVLKRIRDYSRVRVFPVAVYPVVFVAARGRARVEEVIIERVSPGERGAQIISGTVLPYSSFSDAERGWDLSLNRLHRELTDRLLARCVPAREICRVIGAATVAEAYEIKRLISDRTAKGSYLRVVNSGTIDRYCTRWGRKPMRYLGRSFLRPIIAPDHLGKLPAERLKQARSPKIIIAGMTLRLECVSDPKGKVLAAKSTTLVFPSQHSEVVLACLNSRLMAFIYEQEFGGVKLEGGYLRIGPPQIERLPLPNLEVIDHSMHRRITELVERIIGLNERITSVREPHERDQLQREIAATDRQIDRLVYELYGLSDEEIRIVEEGTA